MGDVTYSYTRLRKEFNRIPEFQSNEAEQIIDIAPNTELKEQFVTADPYDTEIQNVPQLSESQTNTERINLRPHGQAHVEGGWPMGIDPTEFEEKMKYCKKAERDEQYYSACKGLVEKHMEKYLKQNNAIDIYGTYFNEQQQQQPQEVSGGPPFAKTITVFKDPSPVKRTAASLSWLGDGKKLAVAYCNLRFQASVDGMTTASHIWDITNPNQPDLTLDPPSPLCSIEYYTKDPHLVAGGSYNGVVQYWDTRQPSRPVGRSAIEESHQDPVWDLKWLQSKSGEILTVSTDGNVFIWDIRKTEKPLEMRKFDTETVVLQPKNNEGGAKGKLGGVCIDYDAQVGGPAKYMIGTEQGTVLSCNRKGKTMADKIGANTYNGHHGPVYAVQRNPHHPKYFLTVGDWTARLWFEDTKNTAMYTTFYHKHHITHGCWHPQRAGVFITTRMDGCIDIWDLMYRQSTSVLTVQVSDYALHTIKPTVEGRYIAVGGVDGCTTLLELSPSLYQTSANEKNCIGKMFDNESIRDKNLIARAKEKSKKGQRNQQKGLDKDLGTVDESQLQELADKFLREVEAQEDEQKKQVETLDAKRQKLIQDIEEGLEIDDDAAVY